jgi:NitT/TauT family transport system ATP-binding protein
MTELAARAHQHGDENLCIELKAVDKGFDDPRELAFDSLNHSFKSLVSFFRQRNRQEVLCGLNLKLPHNSGSKFIVLLGPSGCGKSTVLNLISGLLHPDQGKVLINGKELVGPNIFAATVPQAYTCFPWRTVLENVEFGLQLRGDARKERRQKAKEYLDKVGLQDRLNARPKQLSGGMQQRVAIARTLVLKPKIVLMDEPFGALDAQTRAEMQKMLLTLWEEEQSLIIFVTHDINEALLLADDIVVFPPRPVQEIVAERMINVREVLGDRRPRDPASLEFAKMATKLRNLLGTNVSIESSQPELFVPDSKRADWLLARIEAKKEEKRQARRNSLLQGLQPEIQGRYIRPEEKRQPLETSLDGEQRTFKEVLAKRDYLEEKYLLFAGSEMRYRDKLLAIRAEGSHLSAQRSGGQQSEAAASPPGVVEIIVDIEEHCYSEIARISNDLLKEIDADTRASLARQLKALQNRKEFVGIIGTLLVNLRRQLKLLDDLLLLINNELRVSFPEQLLNDIEDQIDLSESIAELLEEFGSHEQVLAPLK